MTTLSAVIFDMDGLLIDSERVILRAWLEAAQALGVPLTAERSLAVDPRVIPLGVPVYLSTTYPGAKQELNRLMVAQDTGGAINGGVRADFYWGFGDAAGAEAGKMKQPGRMWVLLPKGYDPNSIVSIPAPKAPVRRRQGRHDSRLPPDLKRRIDPFLCGRRPGCCRLRRRALPTETRSDAVQ